jgi:hypothetical protein
LRQLLYNNVGKPYGDGIFTINLQPPLNISTITIIRDNSTVNVSLTVCEVEVYEGKQTFEPRHDKTNKVGLRPAWIQTSLRIRAV